MLHLLDDSLHDFLRAAVPLTATDVDIVFEAPDREWAASVSRPTINLYLWDIRANQPERETGFINVAGEDGRVRREGPMPRIDCRYLVTAWTSDVSDEHSLLGRVLTAFLVHPALGEIYLKDQLADVRPIPRLELRAGSASDNPDLWSALGGQLKPGLDLVVTVTVDAAAFAEVGPPVEEILLRQRNRQGAGVGERRIAPEDGRNESEEGHG